MAPYVVLLMYIIVCAFFIRPSKSKKNKKIFIAMTIISFLVLACFRDYTVGADTNQYYNAFSIIKTNSLSWCFKYMRFEKGFIILEKIISLFSSNPQFLLIITSIIIIGAIYYFIDKNSEDVFGSVMLFILLNIFFMYMSAMRQAIAICIIIIGYTLFYKEGKKIKYSICVLIASMFHSSALIMLLLLLFPKKPKYDIKYLFFFIIVSIVCFILPDRVFDIIVGYTKYSAYVSSKYYQGSAYAGTISYIISIVLLLFSYIFSKNKDNNSTINYYLLIMSFNIVFYALAAKISIFTRVTTYFDIFYIIAIPNIMNRIKLKSNQKIMYLLFSIFLVLYWIIVSIYRPEWYGCIPYSFFN